MLTTWQPCSINLWKWGLALARQLKCSWQPRWPHRLEVCKPPQLSQLLACNRRGILWRNRGSVGLCVSKTLPCPACKHYWVLYVRAPAKRGSVLLASSSTSLWLLLQFPHMCLCKWGWRCRHGLQAWQMCVRHYHMIAPRQLCTWQ